MCINSGTKQRKAIVCKKHGNILPNIGKWKNDFSGKTLTQMIDQQIKQTKSVVELLLMMKSDVK